MDIRLGDKVLTDFGPGEVVGNETIPLKGGTSTMYRVKCDTGESLWCLPERLYPIADEKGAFRD